MKKIFILSVATIGLFASCKKSSSSPSVPSGIQATINGSSKNFNVIPTAVKSYLGGIDEIDILGGISTGETINLSIANDVGLGVDSIVAGTYSDTSTKFSVVAEYASLVGASPFEYGGGTFIDGTENPVSVPNHFVITITSITKNSIQGKFSGNIYLNEDATAASYPVVNGSFNLPLTQQ